MGRFIPIQEAVMLPMLGSGDYLQRSKGRFLTWSKFVWEDMQINSVKIARREFFTINKRTNTIDLPCDFSQLCSVNLVDRHGVFYPVYRNDRLHDDLVDISANDNCSCEHKCGYKLCNTIKGYEAVVSTKCDFLPNGTPVEFKCVDRKAVDSNGFLYEVTQYPVREYLSGVWVTTILKTEERKLCKVEVDSNGCCKDTDDNVETICNSCGISTIESIPVGGTANRSPNKHDNKWIYYCNNKMDWFGVQCGNFPLGLHNEMNNIYNISELGNRLIFPHNFGYDKVMVRYYANVSLNNLEIPIIALDTFITGLKWWDNKFNDNPKNQALADRYGRQYAIMKFGLLKELNRYRIAELGKMFTPKVNIPSYVLGGVNNFIIGFNNEGGYGYGDDYIMP